MAVESRSQVVNYLFQPLPLWMIGLQVGTTTILLDAFKVSERGRRMESEKKIKIFWLQFLSGYYRIVLWSQSQQETAGLSLFKDCSIQRGKKKSAF